MAPIPLPRPDVMPSTQIIEDFQSLIISSPSMELIKDFIHQNHTLLTSSTTNFINNKHPRTGMTALHLAVKIRNLQAVQLLMEHGADEYITNSDGLIAAHLAMILKHKSILKVILRESKGDPVDYRGFTHLHLAAMLSKSKYVSKYLEMSGDANVRTSTFPIGYEDIPGADTERALIDVWPVRAKNYWLDTNEVEAARMCQRSFRGYYPLHFAVEHENVQTLERLLLERNIDIDVRDVRGYTPLHLACAVANGDVAKVMVEMLLIRGADILARTSSGSSPLLVATHLGHKNIVDLLLAYGAEANTWEDRNNITALHIASRYLMVDIVLTLLAAGADATRTDEKLRTPLHWMISRDWCYGMNSNFVIERNQEKCCAMYDAIIEALINAKCNIDAQDKWGKTAIVAAALCHNSCASSRLHLWDPNLLIRDDKNRTFETYDISKRIWCASCYLVHPALHTVGPSQPER